MIQKLKTITLSLAILLLPAMMVAAPATSYAAPNQIQTGTCTGASSASEGTAANGTVSCSTFTNGVNDSVNSGIKTVINILSVLVGVVAVIMIIVGGFRYITSGGKQESVAGAKNTILYGIIGLIIVALAQIIVQFVLDKSTSL